MLDIKGWEPLQNGCLPHCTGWYTFFFFVKPPQEGGEGEKYIKLNQKDKQRGCLEEHPPSRHYKGRIYKLA